jgi:hypothetical protein
MLELVPVEHSLATLYTSEHEKFTVRMEIGIKEFIVFQSCFALFIVLAFKLNLFKWECILSCNLLPFSSRTLARCLVVNRLYFFTELIKALLAKHPLTFSADWPIVLVYYLIADFAKYTRSILLEWDMLQVSSKVTRYDRFIVIIG